MNHRRGEKIGWVAGWCGGFAWVAALSVVFLSRGRLLPGLVGMALVLVAVLGIVRTVPWRHPSVLYWKLMLVPYLLFLASGAWAVWAFGGLAEAGLNVWMLVWLVPLLLPFGTIGRRRWTDFESTPGPETDETPAAP